MEVVRGSLWPIVMQHQLFYALEHLYSTSILSFWVGSPFFARISLCAARNGGGWIMGYGIRIIFDPNTRQWGGGGVSRVVIQQ